MMSLRLNLWKDRAQVVEELKLVPQEELIETLLEVASYNPSMQQAIHRLLCRDEMEASLLYEKSFTQVMQEEYSWKYPEGFEGRLNDFLSNWEHLWSVSKQKMDLIIDFYSKVGQILNQGDDGDFLGSTDDFLAEEIRDMRVNNVVDDERILKLCITLEQDCCDYGQANSLVEKLKLLLSDKAK